MGAAASGADSYLLVEEAETDPHPSQRRKGNLYLLAHGLQGARLLRSLRDQYLGDPLVDSSLDIPLALLGSLEAAAALLAPRGAGVSCLAAVASSQRLSLVAAGDCRAFLEERRQGGPQTLLSPRYPHKKLASGTAASLERAQRPLGPGDRVVLCCGPLAQALGLAELYSLLSSQGESSPQALAEQLVAKAEPLGGGAAVVLACREAGKGLTMEPFFRGHGARRQGPGPQAVAATATGGRRRKLPLSWLLAAFVVAVVGAAAVDALGRHLTLPSFSWTWGPAAAPADMDKDLRAQLDALWARGQKGDLQAWREAIALLQKLQSAQPAEAEVGERLRAAELNRLYGEGMVEVALYWGTGETTARRAESWAKAVEVLEGLQAKMGGTGFFKPVLDKLYAARVNYGKALEAAGRLAEARLVYEKARDLDQARPEALDALRRLR